MGSVGDSYNNALAETVNGLFKTELIRRHGPWQDIDHLEHAVLGWVDWWNNQRILGPIVAQRWRGTEANAAAAQADTCYPRLIDQTARFVYSTWMTDGDAVIDRAKEMDRVLHQAEELRQDETNGSVDLVELIRLFGDTHTEEMPSMLREVLDTLAEAPEPAIPLAGLLRALPFFSEVEDAAIRPKLVNICRNRAPDQFTSGFFDGQNHLVLPKLESVAPEYLRGLRAACREMTSLDRAGAVRGTLLKELNRRPNRILTNAFLPGVKELISDFFDSLDAYLASGATADTITAFEHLRYATNAVVRAAEALDTKYARVLRKELIQPVYEMVESKVADSPAFKATLLQLHVSERRYPLHMVGKKLEVPIGVRNLGPGLADNVVVSVVGNDGVSLAESEFLLERMVPGFETVCRLGISISKQLSSLSLMVEVTWRQCRTDERRLSGDYEFLAQRVDVDWAALEASGAYSLEAVESSDDLVGRGELLTRLEGLVAQKNAGCALLHGQKRVGKTSVAKALRSRLESKGSRVIYLEGGDFVAPEVEGTVRQLGRSIVRKLADDPLFRSAEPPKFENSLAPLIEYVDHVMKDSEGERLLIILDEFDELPPGLYARDALGRSFFLSLRSLSAKPYLSVILVGGEKTKVIRERPVSVKVVAA